MGALMNEVTDNDFLEYMEDILSGLTKMAQGREYPSLIFLMDMLVSETISLRQSAINLSMSISESDFHTNSDFFKSK